MPDPTPQELAESNYLTAMHILEVSRNLGDFAIRLMARAEAHDASKLEEPEASGFARVASKLRGMTYGSPEYTACLTELRPTLDYHYARNRHHPQHWKNGIRDMDLVDLVEMFCDWRAATKRHDDGNLHKSIEVNAHRFNLSPDLVSLLENTAKLFDE